jgi:hypothetical protein
MAARIFDVAHRANVSVSTVSNYLNRRLERMAPATQARVQRAISELAFSPSRVARQLKTGQSDIIGLVVPSVANPFFGQLAMAIQTAAQARGYQTLLYNTRRDADSELAIARELAAFGVRGLVTGSAPLNEQHASALADCGLAVVARGTFGMPGSMSCPSTMPPRWRLPSAISSNSVTAGSSTSRRRRRRPAVRAVWRASSRRSRCMAWSHRPAFMRSWWPERAMATT